MTVGTSIFAETIRISKVLWALLLYGFVVASIPGLGILFGRGIIDYARTTKVMSVSGTPRWSDTCSLGAFVDGTWHVGACRFYLTAEIAYFTGLFLAGAVCLQTALMFMAAARVRRDPLRLAAWFGPVSDIVVATWSRLAIVRFINVAAVTYMFVAFIPFHGDGIALILFFVALLLVPASILAVTQWRALSRYRRPLKPPPALGLQAPREEAPELYDFVHRVASELRLAQPARLLVSLDCNFSVTEGPVRVPDHIEPSAGSAIMLSLPLMHLLTEEELGAIVAHELGHLTDPVSQSASRWHKQYAAIVTEMDKGGSIWRVPAKWFLRLLPTLMQWAVAAYRVESESGADATALRNASPQAAVRALLKSIIADDVLDQALSINYVRLKHGVLTENLCSEVVGLYREKAAEIQPGQIVEFVRRNYPQTFDEPSVEQRLANFGFTLEEAVELLARRDGQERLVDVGNLSELERRVSRIVHRFQQAVAGQPGPLPAAEVESMAAFLAR